MAFAGASKLAKLIAATREFGYNVSGVYGRQQISDRWQCQERVTEYLVGDTWVHKDIWKAAERANIAGTATQEQMNILEAGHGLAK